MGRRRRRSAVAADRAGDHPRRRVRIRGSIDRVDFNSAHNGVRVSDYKTGAEPRKGQRDRSRARRRAAARALRAGRAPARGGQSAGHRAPGLPRDRSAEALQLPDVDQAIADIAAHVSAAVDLLRRGIALPGPDAREDWNEFALALPAAPAVYFQSKQAALGRAFGDFARIWSVR